MQARHGPLEGGGDIGMLMPESPKLPWLNGGASQFFPVCRSQASPLAAWKSDMRVGEPSPTHTPTNTLLASRQSVSNADRDTAGNRNLGIVAKDPA
jgi:hypothetical protein